MLNPKQIRALNLLLAGHSCTDVAEHLHIGRKTLFRWRTANPDFRQSLARLASAAAESQSAHLDALSRRALRTLRSQLADPWRETSCRAAKTVLSLPARHPPP